MKRSLGVVAAGSAVWWLGVIAGSAAAAPPNPVDEFALWAASSGMTVTSVACSEDVPPVCYGLDPESNTITARRNDDATFVIVEPAPTAPAADPAPVDPSAGVGTRANPVPIGTPVDIGDGWTLVVNSVNPDATAAVTGENMFNDSPPDGSVYVLVNITATYNGTEEKAMPFFWISGVTSSNVEIDGLESFVIAPDPFDSMGEVFVGGSSTGNVVLTVPTAEVSSLVLYTSAGFSGNDVYFASV